jgi:dihydrofolate reductase
MEVFKDGKMFQDKVDEMRAEMNAKEFLDVWKRFDASVEQLSDEKMGIGAKGTIPWRIPKDMAFFKKLTTEAEKGKVNAVIMGRKTFESIPPDFRPLSNRLNIVITRQTDKKEEGGVIFVNSLESALDKARKDPNVDQIFVIGGAEVYREAMIYPCKVYMTRIMTTFPECDVFFPQMDGSFEIHSQGEIQRHKELLSFRFEQYIKK